MARAIAICLLLVARAQAYDKDPSAIVRRNVFCSGCGQLAGPRASPTSLELVATMVCPADEEWSAAVVRDLSTREKDPLLVRRGDALGASTVVKVMRRRIWLMRDGRLELLALERAGPPAEREPIRCHGSQCTVERALVERLVRNPTALGELARVVPSPDGFRLEAIRPGSLLARIGLESGDGLRAVNGMPLATLDDAIRAFRALRDARRLSVRIERAGRPLVLDYAIE